MSGFHPRRIVFYQPPTEASRVYSDANGREQVWLPHGILSVAAMLDQRNWEAELVDGRLDPGGGIETLREKLRSSDVLACSVMTGNAIRWALKASEIAKVYGVKTVWGGPHPTLFPLQTLLCPLVDFIVAGGRGEEAFAEWASAISQDRPFIPGFGIGSKRDRTPVFDPGDREAPLPPRDSLPSPRLNLIQDFSPYLMNDPAVTGKTTNHVTSVGCPYSCIFCSEPRLSGRRWYAWSAERSAEEVARLVRASGATGVKLHDALFFVDMKRALTFAHALEPLQIKWAATIHPRALVRVIPPQLSTLRQSGLSRLMVGIESGNQFVVNLVGKRFDVREIPEMALKLRQADIIGMFSFVVGFPNAPQDEYRDTIEAAHSIHNIWDKHQVKIHYASPWPGTELWALASSFPGFSPPRSLSEWADYDYYIAQMAFHDRRWDTEIEGINDAYCPYFHA